jgi:hypothetical protein
LVEVRVTGRVDMSQCKNKNGYYYSFKTQIEGQPGQGPSHVLGESTWVDPGQHKIKVIIIIVLKLYSGLTCGNARVTDQEGQPKLT